MSYDNIIVEVKDTIAWITLNRPAALNALSYDTMKELRLAIEEMGDDTSVRAVVIRGSGRCFGPGADLKTLPLGAKVGTAKFMDNWHGTLNAIEHSPKVVIAAVHGFAYAGSLELVMACDLAVAVDTAQLADQHANLGLPSTGSASQRLPRLVGIRKAKELIITGDRISGTEAERIGLVNKAVPEDKFEQAVKEFAEKVASKSPLVAGRMKQLINWGTQADFNTAIAMERLALLTLSGSEDSKEGVSAFQEKRKPVFKGR